MNNYFEALADYSYKEQVLFMNTTRILLESTFLLEKKNKEEYYFFADTFHRETLRHYLSYMGYDVYIDTTNKFLFLALAEEYEEYIKNKNKNRVSLNNTDIMILLVLQQHLKDSYGAFSEAYLSKRDLLDMLNISYNEKNVAKVISKTSLKESMEKFKRFNLVDFTNYDIEDCVFTLYPTLFLGFDEERLVSVIERIVPELSVTDDENEVDKEDEFYE